MDMFLNFICWLEEMNEIILFLLQIDMVSWVAFLKIATATSAVFATLFSQTISIPPIH